MNSQPTAQQAGPVPVGSPPGTIWSWCMPLDWVDINTCIAELRWTINNTQFRPNDIWDTCVAGPGCVPAVCAQHA